MKLILFFLSAVIIQCSSSDQKTSADKNLKPVIFVHGYLGSRLVKEDGEKKETVWITPCQGLNFCTSDLSLKNNDGIESEEILKKITAVPMLYELDIYDSWTKRLLKTEGFQAYFFHYDWRKDNSESAAELEKFTEKISKDHNRKVFGIGHSNGGLLTLSVLNRRPELYEKAVFAGSPFRAGIGFTKDLIHGTKIGSNEKILSSCTLQTFESVFNFLSSDSGTDTQEILFDSEGKRIPFNVYNAEFWKSYNLGPYHKGSECADKSLADFQKQLDKARVFRKSLLAKKIKYPPLLSVMAENRTVIRKIKGKKEKDSWIWDTENPERDKGDGSVLFSAAHPSDGIPFETFISEAEHTALLNDARTAEAVIDFLKK
ncbi:MAG TPA: lecithin--cholesterol acyltransferase [Leptospiraceae bacterium]|nr:lecithin--cholesterol acyltransferase [Leptospiraceae bacterium]HNI97246.1 lecithin--cholesterol acyltransferase [Leptospiraceae bacterium]HNM03969.1 lecithin--cholesterol acyltransferase [Leptospiraceae bacterium]HNN06696.1 lecithin--cholesterol acyltransferase [Leptospiraceae bacterium]HNO21705.1 lecithin--cholesterol acyltransferase [Leptospiraceae bacterium]